MRFLWLAFPLAASLAQAPSSAGFTAHTVATGLKGAYQVVIADLNHDGKPDLIALASGMTDLVWYENPTWERHVLASNLPRLINCAPGNPDAAGIPEIVVAWEFANEASKSLGKVGVLHHRGDPREPWALREIDAYPTSHRIRWADLDGNGKLVALNAPLTGESAKGPLYAGHTPLFYYRPGSWKREVLDAANEGVQHGILVTRWMPGDLRDSVLTASFSGIHLLRFEGGAWKRTELSKGDPAACPKCGASDVALGTFHLGTLPGKRFLAAIEPWHGNQVVVYPAGGQRMVIDDSLTDGHTILAADFDGDGNDEIVVGMRQGAKAVYVYRWDGSGWGRAVVDSSGLGAAACAAADLNGDGRVDLACMGSAGAVLRWYENVSGAGK